MRRVCTQPIDGTGRIRIGTGIRARGQRVPRAIDNPARLGNDIRVVTLTEGGR